MIQFYKRGLRRSVQPNEVAVKVISRVFLYTLHHLLFFCRRVVHEKAMLVEFLEKHHDRSCTALEYKDCARLPRSSRAVSRILVPT
jgi:hypothetical protein